MEISRICDKTPEHIVEYTTSLLSALGTVSKQEFADVMVMSLRTVERGCKDGKIPTILGFPSINLYMKINKKQ